MPLYDFKCSKCNTVTEKLVKHDVKTVECPQCKNEAVRLLAAPGGFQLNGDGWYKPSAKPVDGTA